MAMIKKKRYYQKLYANKFEMLTKRTILELKITLKEIERLNNPIFIT